MSLRLYNTLSRSVEAFVPIDPACVRMYVCGPTVYDYVHIGNARACVVFDTLYRLLKRRYPRVIYARNITDVDDKIIHKHKETGESIDSITTRTTTYYHQDMDALGALRPDIEPRATDHIGAMQAMIQTLIDKGHAYAAEGHVLFHVPSMPDHGALSRQSRDERIAGARVEVAPYKKDPADFVLWKPSAPDDIGWDSPWGRGRPGWHIECSAMAAQHLGPVFDIHGGGLDLIFPHHENEIAQSRCAHGTERMANVWMHNGFLTVNDEKMSKSLGNFTTAHALLERYHGEVLRLALLSAHYRQPLDFSDTLFTQTRAMLDRWYGVLRDHPSTGDAPIPSAIEDAMDDDMNTPRVIAEIHALADAIVAGKETPDALRAAASALGVLCVDPEEWFHWAPVGTSVLSQETIEAAIAARRAARTEKKFEESDRIRNDLLAKGVALEDGPHGTRWRRVTA